MDFDPNSGSGVKRTEAPRVETGSLVQHSLKGRYRLVRELGRGGFGVTYLATDEEVASRKVVVKVLAERRADDAWSLRKFQDEMQALARIDHPGVVAVVDFGYLPDGRPFLVMRYVPGKPLRELIPRGGMPLQRLAGIVRQTGCALTAAHDAGVCHRDLKPANIMVHMLTGGEEQVVLIDFGIASVRDLSSTSTSQNITGTWEYMAPEQFMGKSSPASDIYQLGVLAYELATGIVPFRSATPADLLRQKTGDVKVRPKDLRPDLPETAQGAILRALAPNPAERYPRARDLGDSLAAAVSGVPDGAAWNVNREILSTRTDSFAARGARTRTHARRQLLALATLGLLALAAAVFFRLGLSRLPAASSVAVLPFQDRIADSDMDYLSDGITESLTNDLARIGALRLSAYGSVQRYRGPAVDPLRAGRELRVDRVVRGSVSRMGDELRIEAELVDAHSGAHLWGHSYTTRMSSLPEALEQFSMEVTDQLRLSLSGPLKERLARQYAVGSEPYQYYLKALSALNKRTPEEFETAIKFFDQAIAKNSQYAPAHAGLAYTYAQWAMHASVFGGVAPKEMLEEARRAAQKALELDGTLAEAYTSLAYVQMQGDYQWALAEHTFQTAIALEKRADALEFYALELAALGRFDEGLVQIKRAEALDPETWAIRAAHATILYYARRYDESLAILRDYSQLGDVIAPNYWAQSMPQEALAAVLRIPETFTPHLRIPLLVSAYARAGEKQRARTLLMEYRMTPENAAWYYLALAHLSLGDRAEALSDLERDYQRRSAEILFVAVDPMMDGLRAEARFRALIARMKLN